MVASWAALSERCAGAAQESDEFLVSEGQGISPEQLARELESRGYAVSEVADRQGSFTRRGGIIDCFPAGSDEPARIEFFGDQVESIRLLDLRTQRSLRRTNELLIDPVATASRRARDEAQVIHDQVRSTGDKSDEVIEQLTLIADGMRSDFERFFEPILYASTAMDALSGGALLLVEDEQAGQGHLEHLLEQQRRSQSELERRGLIPRGLPSLNVDVEAVQAGLAAARLRIRLDRFGDETMGTNRLPFRVTPSFAGRLKTVVEQAAAWAKQGKAVVIASQQALRLADVMDEEGVRAESGRRASIEAGAIHLLPLALLGGFIFDEDLILLTDAEIFGFRKRRRPTNRRPGIAPDIVSSLEIGDYLVHADHGIARYGGLVRRISGGIEREYLELQYAEGDRLFVPADQLDGVTAYVGPADHPPALTRLGSQEWARAKRRVKQAVIEMAHELLELYAKREVALGHAFAADGAWQMEMEAAFPFVETPDQLEAIHQVKADMERDRPMDRLICGDVGYGKTEVAIRAAFKAVAGGTQVAVLVPTTVLAEQHGSTFRERTAGFPIRVEVLSRFRSDEQQRDIVRRITAGEVDIAIGTHRLLGKDVVFKDLGLVVIDEEQRFGVSHKERLKQMREEVDTLTLSATPIPRTLQMSLVGIRDMSTVMSPPEERLPVKTYVLQWDDELIREAIERELQRGGQVYFVHNRVHNIERIVTKLREIVPEANVTIGHGQMAEDQLERVMMEFSAGDFDVLVCTTIIESGLDIPNANTIIINDADRLGLAQLYQLRGRVGRATNRAYAYLLYDKDRTMTEHAQKRLEAIFEASELGAGFQIAMRDLEIRGAGNVLGTEQSGHIASVGFDMYSKLVAEAVSALKMSVSGEGVVPAPPPPTPSIELPITAHIPEIYMPDIHSRLAAYQRIAEIDSAEGVAAMQAELKDRFGTVPPAVENLLFVSLVKSMARKAGVEAIKTDEHMFHIRMRHGPNDGMRMRVEALKLKGIMIGPNQVRLDRITSAANWQTVIVRVLRAMAETKD